MIPEAWGPVDWLGAGLIAGLGYGFGSAVMGTLLTWLARLARRARR